MIIVSQDKSVIVNFNNIESIEIGNAEENQGKGIIYARLVSDYFYKIGEYETEKRAKEVLQEIVSIYRCSKTCESSITEKLHAKIAVELNNMKQSTFLYEMPED